MTKAGQDLDGRAIRVDFSGNKKRDGDGGGGGGGNRGGFNRGGPRGGSRGGNDFASQNKGSISNFQGQKTRF